MGLVRAFDHVLPGAVSCLPVVSEKDRSTIRLSRQTLSNPRKPINGTVQRRGEILRLGKNAQSRKRPMVDSLLISSSLSRFTTVESIKRSWLQSAGRWIATAVNMIDATSGTKTAA